MTAAPLERIGASPRDFNQLRHTGASRYPEPLAPSLLPLDPGFRRDDAYCCHSQKNRARHGRACPGHPRFGLQLGRNSWMAGRPAMTDWVSCPRVITAFQTTRIMHPPRPSKGRSREALRRRDEVRRPRASSQRSTRAALGLPPGPLGVPARSWLKARSAHSRATDRTKAGPVAAHAVNWRAARRLRAARHEP